MKPLITFAILLASFAGTAVADHISIYTDQGAVGCTLSNPVPPPGLNPFYLIHRFNSGATASQFKVNDTTGLFPAAQTTTFLFLGTWNTDLSLAYGGCLVGDVVLMRLDFIWFGTPLPNNCLSKLEVVAAPTSPIPGDIALVDCTQPSGNLEPASGGSAFLNATQECPEACQKLAVEESTWGGVKALYR